MAILVTGGAGYIGGHTVLGLCDAGESPVVVDNLSSGVRHAVPNGVPLIVGDVGDFELVSRVIKEYEIDAIIHFAGQLITNELRDNPLSYYRTNVAGSRALLAAVQEASIEHFIYSGSAAVYGDPLVNPVPETAAIQPISAYGTSKLIPEFMLRDLSAISDLNYVTLRYFNVAGADPSCRYGQSSTASTLLVQLAAQAALGKRSHMEVYGTDYDTRDGTCIRDYVHVTDLVDAHLAALRYLRSGGSNMTLNCGYGHGYSVLEILNMAKRISGHDFEVRTGPRRTGDAVEVVADAAKIREMFDWSPQYDDIEKIVGHAIEWERKLGSI